MLNTNELRYFRYLCRIMRLDSPEHRNYSRLFERLYGTTFVWVHPLDENRVADGLDLREDYIQHLKRPIELNRAVNVLEMLAAFSKRIEENILGEPGNDKIERMFWVMLENLGLLYFDDSNFDDQKVDEILQNWMLRKGEMSLFPLRKLASKTDMYDFWWQMQLYVEENY